MELNDVKKILFYDGECGFCNSTVQFILAHKKNDIYFVPLQSNFAQNTLNKKNIKINMDTLYFLKNNTIYSKSSAVLQIIKDLKFPYPLLLIGYIFPKFIRDFFYTQIANKRHKINGKYCLIPKQTDKKFFIADIINSSI